MTRINLIPATELHSKHLMAEYRELPRVFGCVAAALLRGERPDDRRNPKAFTLGTGHMRFFYPRLLFLAKRHAELTVELVVGRGYRLSEFVPLIRYAGVPDEWWGDYEPTPEALALSRARILERMPKT